MGNIIKLNMITNDCVNGIFLLAKKGRKRERISRCCFVSSKIPGEILKGKRTFYWCKDCGKVLCVVPCFKLYHTPIDYKLHAKNFRQGTLEVEAVKW